VAHGEGKWNLTYALFYAGPFVWVDPDEEEEEEEEEGHEQRRLNEPNESWESAKLRIWLYHADTGR
jgi:hypothetical protein